MSTTSTTPSKVVETTTTVTAAAASASPIKRIRLQENQSGKDQEDKDQEADVRIYEYTSAANPELSVVPVVSFPSSLHESGATRIIPFDLKEQLGVDYSATSPNLLAAFLRIEAGDSLPTHSVATSQAFYVIRGQGSSTTEHGDVSWSEGDMFVVPFTDRDVVHTVAADATSSAALYWMSDEPLLHYLGVRPVSQKFNLTVFRKQRMLAEVQLIQHDAIAEKRNRCGILLGNRVTENTTKTLTHTLWSLLNMLPAGDAQRPHRHNSVAIDLCVSAQPSGVYTMMGPELDDEGWVKNPMRCDWKPGAVFITPPGWWHSHHNESGEPAWVLPMQDAGLYTYQRTLDIRFSVAPK